MRTRIKVSVASSEDTREKLKACFIAYRPKLYLVRVFGEYRKCTQTQALEYIRQGFDIRRI